MIGQCTDLPRIVEDPARFADGAHAVSDIGIGGAYRPAGGLWAVDEFQ